MKYIRIFIIMLVSSVVLTSCFDDTTIEDEIQETPNLVGFANATTSFSAVADGSELDRTLGIRLFGPRLDDVNGTVTANISVDQEASTAVEGVHYRLDATSVTINSEEDNNLTVLPFTMLTEGIVPPLDENPVVVLRVESVSGDGSVVASGQPITVQLLYACPSDLAGAWQSINHTWEPNCDGNAVPVTVTVEPIAGAAGAYIVSDITDLYFSGDPCQPADICGVINEVCGNILVSSGASYGCSYGYNVSGSGTLSDDGNTITMMVTNDATGSEDEIILTR